MATATSKPSGILAPAAPLSYAAPFAPARFAYAAPVPVAYSAPAVAYSAPAVAYSAPVLAAAPDSLAYSAPAAVAVPPPVSYATGHEVSLAVEPVEQHGYSIAY